MDSSLKDNIKVIAFDADDTLWANQPYFDDAEDRLCSILAEYGEPRYIKSDQPFLFIQDNSHYQRQHAGSGTET